MNPQTIFASYLAAAVLAAAASTQDPAAADDPLVAMPELAFPLTELLVEIERDARAGLATSELTERHGERGVKIAPSGRVQVELCAPLGTPIAVDALVAQSGGIVAGAYANRAEAWVPAERLTELAARLPAGHHLQQVSLPGADDVVGEGPAAANSAAWRDAGSDGSGVTIAVIDQGFDLLSEGQASGDIPTGSQLNLVSLVFIGVVQQPVEAGSSHGTSCVEVIYDHCPGATYWLYRIDTVADIGQAVNHAIAKGVDIISMSQSWYNQGWTDDSGPACSAANDANDNDVLFLTSAGNRQTQHWQGAWTAGSGSSKFHDWTPGVEALPITMPAGGGGLFYLAWNNQALDTDLDLILYDDVDLKTPIASSIIVAKGVFESFSWKNNGSSANTVYLGVRRNSGSAPEMEVFMHAFDNACTCSTTCGSFGAFAVPAGSTTSPSNATRPSVLSIGAVPQASYGAAPGAGVIKCYSSQGPTNEGAQAPDLCGPTDISTNADAPAAFGGTSCATPSVAGLAGVLLSDNPSLSAQGLAWLLRQQARLTGDWGQIGGTDFVYGHGGVHLVDFHPDTLFLDPSYGNVGNTPAGPYSGVQEAHDAASSGGRLLFLFSASYFDPLSLPKPLTYEVLGGTASLRP